MLSAPQPDHEEVPTQDQRDLYYDLLQEDRRRVAENLGTYHVGTSRDTLPWDMTVDESLWQKNIHNFLQQSELYDPVTQRWVEVPDTPESDSNLHKPYFNIFSAVVAYSRDKNRLPGSTRRVVSCYNRLMPHATEDENYPTVYSAPTLAVVARGPSFQGPKHHSIGYSNIASCIEIKTNDSDVDPDNEIHSLGIFARQLYNQQPNREFVRCLLITETHALLVHYDRAGVQWFPLIDIHGDPYTFLRVVFALTSLDEMDLGFDPSIQWEYEHGKKIRGTIGVCNDEGIVTSYPLLNVNPVFMKYDIRGSGTRCWKVSDPSTGRELIIKDAWTPADTTLEADNLKVAKGLPGVVQMVARDAKQISTDQFRGSPTRCKQAKTMLSRTGTRVILESYGLPIYLCPSERRMIGALRDAIRGHWELLKVGLVHRDISRNNVLLGDKTARPGFRGYVIDLDLAARTRDLISGATRNLAVGTLAYQSIAVLRSRNSSLAKRQIRDHLDDLESFFYVLCDTMFCWEEGECPDWMWTWAGEDDPEEASWGKLAFFYASEELDLTGCDPHWGTPARNLIKAFFKFIRRTVMLKERINRIDSRRKARDAQLGLIEERDAHYKEVLSFFDVALEEAGLGPEHVSRL